MKDKDFPAAVTVLEAALAQAKRKFGEETPEACEWDVGALRGSPQLSRTHTRIHSLLQCYSSYY